MWKLQPTESETGAVSLLAGKEYVVGRRNCDIILSSDQSISRVHAHLTVTEQTVTLKDSSKYGTSVNDERLETGSTKTLHAGDRLLFGVFQSKFKLELDVLVCSSCVDNEGKAALSKAVESLGGRLFNSWSQECTHLVMPSVKITIKTICALLCCRPIVKPEFFTELSRAVQQRKTLPKAESFRPGIDEPSLKKDKVDLGSRPERKMLFSGKKFVFLNTKQMKRLSQAISCGGGSSQLLEEGSLPLSLLESTETCVVDVVTGSSQTLVPSACKKWADSVGQILDRNALRFITESEIGLAAIYVNNQTYCNPRASLDSESVRVKPVIPGGTLSQNAAVDETVLPAASLNITAYAANTEQSQSSSRMDVCGTTAVGETPEKQSTNPPGSTRQSAMMRKAAIVSEPPITSSKSVKSSVNTSEEAQEKKTESAVRRNDGSVGFEGSLNNSAMIKKSPQKQTSLASYFQPVSKKRLREGAADSELSEAKLARLDTEDKEIEETKNSDLSVPLKKAAKQTSSHTSQNQHAHNPRSGCSTSLGLGSGIGMSSGERKHNENCDSSLNSGSKKRKEPDQDPEESADLNLSLEELESIMSEDMDEPAQPAATKKQCLDRGDSSSNSNGQDWKSNATSSNQPKALKQHGVHDISQTSEQDKPSSVSGNKDSHSQMRAQRSSNKMEDLEQEDHKSTHKKESCGSSDVKEEEVSFVVATKAPSGFDPPSDMVEVKQEPKGSESGTENDPELPRRLLQVQFTSLTVSASCRSRTEPLQTRDPNGKNFKRFRKVLVPGLQGLPRIIGGSDLVAHTHSKSSELEEWLRDAAEEEKQQEREETMGDDLFRYNPKPTKRR
ncbi:nibrin [Trichomycterus rosablanca]|uniref:nibrin n=1 Tax=Trichomycterus rosablanca TaxID=2290929 RepID=UPI002F357D4E